MTATSILSRCDASITEVGIGCRVVRIEDGKEFDVVNVENPESSDRCVYLLLADDDTELHAHNVQIQSPTPNFRVLMQ